MINFIEVTEKDGNIIVTLPLRKILSISKNKDLTAFIETGIDENGVSTGIFTKELYVEIKKKLAKISQIL